jgi:hypothetical protein
MLAVARLLVSAERSATRIVEAEQGGALHQLLGGRLLK